MIPKSDESNRSRHFKKKKEKKKKKQTSANRTDLEIEVVTV